MSVLTGECASDGHKVDDLEDVPFTPKKGVLNTFPDEPRSEDEKSLDAAPSAMLRGRAKGEHLTERLLASRQEDLNGEKSTLSHKK